MLGVFQNRLRSSLEVLHMAVFFRANAYFQIKSNKDMTVPGSPEYEALEKLETDGYEEAKKLRREILKDVSPQFQIGGMLFGCNWLIAVVLSPDIPKSREPYEKDLEESCDTNVRRSS
jgi:hypothetical protein